MRCKPFNLDPDVATEADLQQALADRESELDRTLELLSKSEKQP